MKPENLPSSSKAWVREALASKLAGAERWLGAGESERLTRLFDEMADLGVADSLTIIANLHYLLERVDAEGLRRWIVTGLRVYAFQPDRLTRYYALTDGFAAESLAFEASGDGFHYLRTYLQFYADGMAGRHMPLQGRSAGRLNEPPARPVITAGELFLPAGYSLLEGDDQAALYRAAVAHALAHIRFSPSRLEVGTLKPLAVAVISLIEDARVEHLMTLQYPGLQGLWNRFHLAEPPRDLSFGALARRLARALHDTGCQDDHYWVDKGVRLFRERLRSPDDYWAFREIGSILANDLGQMRVRFNPQRYVPQPAYRDDNTFLWDFGDAKDASPPQSPLSLGVLVEREERPRDPSPPVSAVEVPAGRDEDARYLYPEWDYKTQKDREEWVTVIQKACRLGPRRQLEVSVPHHRSRQSIFALVKARQLNRGARLTRQWEGDGLDLNSAIAAQVDLRSGLPPDPRIFVRPGRRVPKPSVLILLDLSESTNDPIPGSFESVLDLAKRATILLGQAVEESAERFAVDAFSSNGRSEVEYFSVKDFGVPFGKQQIGDIASLRAQHSTRMGAALRHAGSRLRAQPGERRVLLLVTDGEPSDIDVSDADYLVEDAAAAARVLRSKGVFSFCVTCDPHGERYVRRIFGGSFLIVENILDLPAHLSRAFVRLLNA